jgi:hypothetical protein
MKSEKRFIKMLGYTAGLALMVSVALACSKKSAKGQEEAKPGITYEASSEIFPNTERGFAKTLNVQSGGAPLNLVQLKSFRGQNISLVVRVFYLNAYKDRPLDAAELQLINSDLNNLREAGLKGVIRFAYTDQIDGIDAPLSVVQQHLDQLKPVFETHKDVIAFVQAGFIGAWGEWHNSSNGLTSPENKKIVLEKLLSVLPKNIMVQVRTPLYKQGVFNTTSPVSKTQGYSTDNIARVGHHNDCFLSSTDDYGTYLNIAAEKQYISNEALYVPVGGETCPPLAGFSPNCVEGRTQMKLLKWTYINIDYYVPTINAWKASGCFEEFQRSLGYRFAMISSNLPETASGTLKLNLQIINNGYAPLYNKKSTSLVLKNKASGAFHSVPLGYDMRDCKPSATITLDESVSLAGIPAGEYALYIRIADQAESLKSRLEYAVRFANAGTWTTDNGGMNDLKTSLKIN